MTRSLPKPNSGYGLRAQMGLDYRPQRGRHHHPIGMMPVDRFVEWDAPQVMYSVDHAALRGSDGGPSGWPVGLGLPQV